MLRLQSRWSPRSFFPGASSDNPALLSISRSFDVIGSSFVIWYNEPSMPSSIAFQNTIVSPSCTGFSLERRSRSSPLSLSDGQPLRRLITLLSSLQTCYDSLSTWKDSSKLCWCSSMALGPGSGDAEALHFPLFFSLWIPLSLRPILSSSAFVVVTGTSTSA